MSKTSKQHKSNPEIYNGLSEIKQHTTCAITEDVHGLFYIWDSAQACHILKEAIQKTWSNISAFIDEPKQTLLTYHSNMFKSEPPEGQALEITAEWTWKKIMSNAVDRRTSNQVPVIGGRKSTIGLTEYRLGDSPDALLKTPQANACRKLFLELFKAEQAKNPENKDCFITEADLRQYIIDHAAELHTRQDPWRIFQYYRPILIESKILRRK
jgi:hypothetical protein